MCTICCPLIYRPVEKFQGRMFDIKVESIKVIFFAITVKCYELYVCVAHIKICVCVNTRRAPFFIKKVIMYKINFTLLLKTRGKKKK